MDIISVISVISIYFITTISSLNIKEIIDTDPELTRLKAYVHNSDVTLFSDRSSTMTFFAPNNFALSQLPRHLQESLNRPTVTDKDLFNKIMKAHLVTALAGVGRIDISQFNDEVQAISADGGGSIYYFKAATQAGEVLFANGGRVRGQARQASNGIVHIIDAVFYPVPMSDSIKKYIQTQGQQATKDPRTNEFYQLLQSYESQLSSMDSALCKRTALTYINQWQNMKTVFIPSNEAMLRIPILNRQRLINTPNQLCRVVESHIIPTTVLHSAVLGDFSGQSIPALAGVVKAQRYKRGVYVENHCAQGWIDSTYANITLFDGVVHIIDGVLGYVYDSILEKLKNRHDLNQFQSHIKASVTARDYLSLVQGIQNVPDDQKFTVFVPSNTAMRDVDFTQEDNLDEMVLKHMIRGEVSLSSMTNSTVLESMSVGYKVHFQKTEEDTFVIIDHLKARIIEWDQCTQNGIIHVIDHFLGSPTQSIFSEIKINPDLTFLYTGIRDTGMDNILSSAAPQVTMFAPTDKAFELMRQTESGLRLLDGRNEANLRKVLERHVVQKVIYIGDMQAQQMVVTSKLGDSLEIQRSGGSVFVKFGSLQSQRVKVIVPDIRMKNGVMHLVDEVMFTVDGKEWISATTSLHTFTSGLMLFFSIVLHLLR